MIKIALDAMGGDFAPKVNVLGAMEAVKKYSDIEITLFGDENKIKEYLTDSTRIKVVHTDKYFDMGEHDAGFTGLFIRLFICDPFPGDPEVVRKILEDTQHAETSVCIGILQLGHLELTRIAILIRHKAEFDDAPFLAINEFTLILLIDIRRNLALIQLDAEVRNGEAADALY